MNIILNWVISALVVMAAAYVLPGVEVESFWVAFVVSLVLGLVNAVLKPIAVVLTLPITIVSLGLFLLVINALMVLLVDWIVPGFEVANFWWALLFGFILSVVHKFVKREERGE